MIARRRLLGSGTAFASLALAGCAARPALDKPIGRVVVVGAGFGGATAAHYLRRWGPVEVTLVERGAAFVSCPVSNLVLSGERELSDITRSHQSLKALGVTVLQDTVTAIDAQGRRLRLASGTDLSYDRLVLSPGIDFMPEEIGGLAAALERQSVLHAWKAGPQTLALRARLQALPEGGVVAITIPKAPYRCPPGPYERACVVADWLQRNKPRAKLLLLDANPEVQSKKALFERAFKERYTGVLEYRPASELREVAGDAGSPVARTDFEDVRADLLNVIPPQRGGDIALRSGLLNINRRWAGVHWLTMESTVAPGVHVLGDATLAAPAMPKSAHIANQQAKVAAAAIIQLLQGQAVNPTPVLMNTCYSHLGAGIAAHVASVHQYDAAEQTFKTVACAGGVSPAASELEARYAEAWAQNIWADTLGG